MPRYTKTPFEKFETKRKNLLLDSEFVERDRQIYIQGKKCFRYTTNSIRYNGVSYYPTKVEPFVYRGYEVVVPISHENLSLLSSALYNSPYGVRYIADLFRERIDKIKVIEIGATENSSTEEKIKITKQLYLDILKINKEEAVSKHARFRSRIAPLVKEELGLSLIVRELQRDYSLLLRELLASGELGQHDLQVLINKFDEGEEVKVIIDKQINKQVRWLIDKIEYIIEHEKLTTPKVKELGKVIFGYNKIDIVGPEQFMEKILTDYGQYTLFGVPALLNTDKYVVNSRGLSRSQFDLILINHLGEVEVVELKRPDDHILDFDASRNKFYASKNLSVAISQSERYISAVYRDNDDEYLVKGQKLREFIVSEVGDSIYIESVRPTALIIIGSYLKICKPYSSLSRKNREKITKSEYDKNSSQAYRELKDAFKHIKIITYSELLENARTRLQLFKEEEEE